jgi:SAM-dependent methyltransferase
MPIASRRGLDERATLLPAEIASLLDDGFVRSCDLLEEYVTRLAIGIAREAGIEGAMTPAAPASEVVARAGLDAEAATAPVAWILGMLAARGVMPPLPEWDPREIEAEQEAHDPRCLPSYRIAALAARHYPAVLRGEESGESALFAADHMEAWAAYFSNDNPAYGISNRIAALPAARALAVSPGAVLELGGGLGSGAAALLELLREQGRLDGVSRYRFTEISLPFLRRAQRSLSRVFPDAPLELARLDIDRPFSEAGVEPGAFTLVHAVNVVHVARDLAFTLGEIKKALRSGGKLVAGECVRPFPGRPIYVELVFNLLQAFRRPGSGFRTPEQWTEALAACGFTDVRIEPDVTVVREAYPSFVVAAVTATRP